MNQRGPEPGPRTSGPPKNRRLFSEVGWTIPNAPIRYTSMSLSVERTSSATPSELRFFALDGFDLFVFTACPVMVKPEVILSFVQLGNPSKPASFHASIVALIQDYSAAFLRSPKTLKKQPTDIEMAAIIETLRQFAKDDFRFGLFGKNLALVYELMGENAKREIELLHNSDICMVFKAMYAHLRASSPTARYAAEYSPDRRTVTFKAVADEPVKRGRGRPRKSA